MSWGEALTLTRELMCEPESHVAAALAGWGHPVSREYAVLMDLFDLTHQAAWAQGDGKGPRPKPYLRPWKVASSSKVVKPSVSQDVVVAALRLAGHHQPIPTV